MELAPAGLDDGIEQVVDEVPDAVLQPVDETRCPRLLQQPALPRVGGRISIQQHGLPGGGAVGEAVAEATRPQLRGSQDRRDVVGACHGVELASGVEVHRTVIPQGREVLIGMVVGVGIERVVVHGQIFLGGQASR